MINQPRAFISKKNKIMTKVNENINLIKKKTNNKGETPLA